MGILLSQLISGQHYCTYMCLTTLRHRSECSTLVMNIIRGQRVIINIFKYLNLMWVLPCIVINALGNKRPTRCNRLVFYCKTYDSLNMFRAPLCPPSWAQELYRWLLPVVLGAVVFQVAGLVWSWGLCVRFNYANSHHTSPDPVLLT